MSLSCQTTTDDSCFSAYWYWCHLDWWSQHNRPLYNWSRNEVVIFENSLWETAVLEFHKFLQGTSTEVKYAVKLLIINIFKFDRNWRKGVFNGHLWKSQMWSYTRCQWKNLCQGQIYRVTFLAAKKIMACFIVVYCTELCHVTVLNNSTLHLLTDLIMNCLFFYLIYS